MSHLPLEAFFRKPERAIARLSPDGRHVAFLGRWERRMNLFVRQLETGEEPTGYGRDHWQAGFGQWGLAMQDDVEDGVRWAVEQGIADPSRVAIYGGGSYGGYATLSGITKTPTLYRCAISVVGISNLLTWMAAIPPYWELYRARVEVMVGDPDRDRERLEATSPALHADRIQTPLFIAQGANDPRVKKAESEQMVEALHRHGVAVEYMLKEDEGHGFRNEENEIEFYRAAERFLGEHLTDSMR